MVGFGWAKPAGGGAVGGDAGDGPSGGQAGGPVEDPYAPAAAPAGQPVSGALLLDEMIGEAAAPPAMAQRTGRRGRTAAAGYRPDRQQSPPAAADFDAEDLQTLAESIAAHGLLQPVVVRRVGDRYELVAGERRLQAAKRAGWTDVPVNIIEADDRQTAELAIVENLHRKDLNPLEKAASFHRYLEHYGCTQEELAGRLNLDRSTIANLIRLLELPEPVQEAIREGKITQGHARAMLPLGDERRADRLLRAAFKRRNSTSARPRAWCRS